MRIQAGARGGKTLLALMLVSSLATQLGCRPRVETRLSPSCCKGVRVPTSALLSLDSLMRAAQRGDTVAMKELTVSDQPIAWLLARRAATPEFFEQSRTLEGAEYSEASPSTITMTLSVAYRGFAGLCQRAQPPDLLIVDVRQESGAWKVSQINNQIC